MLTEKNLTEICKKICADAGYNFTIPVKINKRLTRTLGRVSWIRINGKVQSTLMEFSYEFLSTSTFESIKEVIEHECAHYLVIEETHEAHGHDFYFKNMCARINCTNDGSICKTVNRTLDETKIYKYFVKCKKCGNIVGKYHKAGKLVKYPDLYLCKCGGDLETIQNF